VVEVKEDDGSGRGPKVAASIRLARQARAPVRALGPLRAASACHHRSGPACAERSGAEQQGARRAACARRGPPVCRSTCTCAAFRVSGRGG
jgi:hypothetical protein